MNVSVSLENFYNESKDATLKVWILNSQSKKVSEASANTTILGNTIYPNRMACRIELPPPKWGWWNGRYNIRAKLYDEQNVYREKVQV